MVSFQEIIDKACDRKKEHFIVQKKLCFSFEKFTVILFLAAAAVFVVTGPVELTGLLF